MWQHNYEPVGGSLTVSALVAAIPILVLFVMLGALRKPAWMSAMAALIAALLVALGVYGMPIQLAVISTLYGAAYGLFPIAWIVFTSIMLYRLAVDTGKFEIIKDSIGGLTDDRRLQAMFIAFSFGAFIEGAAGFGAPVAVSGAMLAGLGFNPFYAAGICLLANTAPVAFGSIGIPVVTLATDGVGAEKSVVDRGRDAVQQRIPFVVVDVVEALSDPALHDQAIDHRSHPPGFCGVGRPTDACTVGTTA